MSKAGEQGRSDWLLVSLSLPERFVDPVSNFLMEQGARGIEEEEEELGRERIKAYFARDGDEGGVLRSLRRYLRSLGAIHSDLLRTKIETLVLPEQDWGENWKRFFKPFRVTSRIVVQPPWSTFRRKKSDISIRINPGMAFGTGTHATTRLCIRALEEGLRRKGLSVLDVGTGSGILAILAAKMRAEEIVGIDTDPLAVEMARENSELNLVSDLVRIKRGSIGCVRERFDVVVANLDFRGLRRMRRPLLRHLKAGGLLILSGVLKEEEERLRSHYVETGLLEEGRGLEEEGWVCLTFRRKKR